MLRDRWIFSEPTVHPESYYAEECFGEDSATHFAGSFATVYEHNWHFFDFKADFVGGVFHFDLECVAFEAYFV